MGKSKVVAEIEAILGSKKKSSGAKKGKKGRKIGRYSKHPSSVRYRSEQRWVKNKVKRVRRHLKRQPMDRQAREWFSQNGGKDAQSFLASLPMQW